MTATQKPDISIVRRLKNREVVTRQSYLRELRHAAESTTQTQLARMIGISQPSVSSALKAAATVPEVPAGFSGASPYEIAQRFDAGELTREQIIDELVRWPYRPGHPSDGYDWITYDPGEFEEVGQAYDGGLIDAEMYDEILTRSTEHGK